MTIITEAARFDPASDLTGKSWSVRIISGDTQGSSAYYPSQVLESGAHLFVSGTRVYADHPTVSEQEERPARSIRDLVGFLSEDAKFDGKDLVGSVTFLPSQIERMRELAEAGLIGLSIRALGEFAEDGETLAKFQRVLSVDVVTEAGAGGEFRRITEASASESGAGSRKEEEDMDEIKEALAALIESNKALAESIKADRDERKAAEAKAVEEAEKAAEADKPKLADVDAALNEAELSASGRKAVLEAFEGGRDWKPVLESEKAREDEIRESIGAFRGGNHQDLNESKDSGADLAAQMFG